MTPISGAVTGVAENVCLMTTMSTAPDWFTRRVASAYCVARAGGVPISSGPWVTKRKVAQGLNHWQPRRIGSSSPVDCWVYSI